MENLSLKRSSDFICKVYNVIKSYTTAMVNTGYFPVVIYYNVLKLLLQVQLPKVCIYTSQNKKRRI